MPQTVEVPNIGTVEFPDEMTPDQISAAIHQSFFQSSPAQSTDTFAGIEPGFFDNTPPQPIGPEGRASIEGVMSEPATGKFPGDLTRLQNTSAAGDIYQAATSSLIPEEQQKKILSMVSNRAVGALTSDLTGNILDYTLGRDKADQLSGGVARGLARLSMGLISPLGIASPGFGKLPAVAQKAIALGFAAKIAKDTPEAVQAIGEAKSLDDAAEKSTELIGNLALAGAGFKYGLGRPSEGGLVPIIDPKSGEPIGFANRSPQGPVVPEGVNMEAGIVQTPSGPARPSADGKLVPILSESTEGKSLRALHGKQVFQSTPPPLPESPTPVPEAPAQVSKTAEAGGSPEVSALEQKLQAILNRHKVEPDAAKQGELFQQAKDLHSQIVAAELGAYDTGPLQLGGQIPTFEEQPVAQPEQLGGEQIQPGAEPTQQNATYQITQPESLRSQPEGGTQSGQASEAGPSDSLLGAAQGETGVAEGPPSSTQSKVRSPESTQGGVYPTIGSAGDAGPQSLGISAPAPAFLKSLTDFNPRGILNTVKGAIGGIVGKTFPKTTIADRASGELAARWISSKIAAPYASDVFVQNVLSDSGIDPVKFGAALTEDNLRSIRKGFVDAGDTDTANKVVSLVGKTNFPFKTEDSLKSFLSDPAVQQAVERHRSLWQETVDPMFRQAANIDPSEILPPRGEDTQARVNLYNDPEGKGKNIVAGTGRGNLTGTFKRKSPFAIRATGTGERYNINYEDMMRNTFARQMEIANKNAFEQQLVDSGNAVIGKPGQPPLLPDGEETVGFPLKRTVLIQTENGQSIPVAQNIYVRKSLASEYRRGADVDLMSIPGAVKTAGNIINGAALAGLTDGTVHTLNLGTALLTRPGVAGGGLIRDSLLSTFGRADVPVTILRTLVKSFQDNRPQLSELAQIGALKGRKPTRNPLSWLIQKADESTRLVLDDTFKKLADQGFVVDTETNRREFVNQVGQYNRRAQGDLKRLARDSGLGPFVTAGTTFNVQGVRMMGLRSGAKATSPTAAAALSANLLSKWVGGAVLVGTLNYLLTKDKGGGVMGRPGVPIGRIDSGKNDENGRPLSYPAFEVLGLGRGLRATGARGFVEAERKGLPLQVAVDSAARDAINTNIGPFTGPVIRFGTVAASGYQPAVGVPRSSAIVPPGQSQTEENFKQALLDANPVVKSIALAREPGQGMEAAIRQQIPRLSLLPSQSPEMMKDYPAIVRRAQANEYVDDVIGRARKMDPALRNDYVMKSLRRLDPADVHHAVLTMMERRIVPPGFNLGRQIQPEQAAFLLNRLETYINSPYAQARLKALNERQR